MTAGYIPVDVAAQSEIVLKALALGVVLGVIYDLFRITRVAFKTPVFIILLEDLLFFGLVTVISFGFVLTVSGGTVRIVSLFAEAVGAVVYYFTAGRVVMAVSSAIIGAIKAAIAFVRQVFLVIFRFLHKIIINPAIKFLTFIVAYILKPVAYCAALAKKSLINLKNLLKTTRKVLYNQKKRPIPPIIKERK